MSKQTDNANLPAKLELRRRLLDALGLERYSVLDLYHGEGLVWGALSGEYEVSVTGVDVKPRTAGTLRMRAENAIRRLDLSRYDVFDLDSYGSPLSVLDALLKRLADGEHRRIAVFWTWGYFGAFARVQSDLWVMLGWPNAIPNPTTGGILTPDMRSAIARSYVAGMCGIERLLQYADNKRSYTGMVACVGSDSMRMSE